MTQPIQEPSTSRSISGLFWGESQLARRPAPRSSAGAMRPWVLLDNGATTAPDNTWMPVPFSDLCYDPTLVTQGDIFDWSITDDGDPGVDRFQVQCMIEGWYEFLLVTTWDNVTSDGTEDFGYAVQNLRPFASNDITILDESIRTSADWLNSTVGGSAFPGEMRDNPYLRTDGIVHLPSSSFLKPRAKQTTGVDRGLSGELFFVSFSGASNDADWTCESV